MRDRLTTNTRRRSRSGLHRLTLLIMLATGTGALGSACATVNPSADFEHASEIISQHTGVGDSYDPRTETMVAAKVAALVADGLTINEAVRISLLNNRNFQAVFLQIGASRADVVQSGLLKNPSMGLSLRFPDGGGLSNLTIGFAQQIVDLWQIPVRKRIAKAELEQTVLTVARQAVNLATDTKLEAYRLLALQRAEDIANQNLRLVERSMELAQDRFHAGEAGKLDVNLSRANVLNVRLNLITIRRDREMAHTALGRTMGLARSDATWALKDALPVPQLPSGNKDSLVLTAMNKRLDARVAASRVYSAEERVRRQYLNVFPNITIGVQLERPDGRAMPGRKIVADTARTSIANGSLTAPSIQSRGQRQAARRQIIDSLLGPTLNITLPIWDQNQAQIAKAHVASQRRRKEYEDLLDSVARDVTQALTAARAGSQLVAFYKDAILPQAQTNVEATRRAYQAGEQSIIVLVEAEKDLIAQQRNYIRAQREYAIATAELERAVGIPLPLESQDPTQGDPGALEEVQP